MTSVTNELILPLTDVIYIFKQRVRGFAMNCVLGLVDLSWLLDLPATARSRGRHCVTEWIGLQTTTRSKTLLFIWRELTGRGDKAGDIWQNQTPVWKWIRFLRKPIETERSVSMGLVATRLPVQLTLNTLRPRQDGCLFPDDIFKSIFLNENA